MALVTLLLLGGCASGEVRDDALPAASDPPAATPTPSTSTAPAVSAALGSEARATKALPDRPALPTGPRTTMVHLFEWRWEDVARECENTLGPGGFAAVQVSPPQEHAELPTHPWYERYQPVSYRLVSRSGDRAAFVDMVRRCKAVAVDIYVDAVLNHMSFVESGVGSGGTSFSRTSYPGMYDSRHFHGCGREIRDQGSRNEIHTCELATLPDLDTGNEHVRNTLAAYLQDLVDVGVAGIRVDAAKHMSPTDLRAIFGRVRGPLYVYQEVIDNDGRGAVTSQEYTPLGDVTELRYGAELSRVFRNGKLAWLETFGARWGFLDSAAAIAFVDNHDNQRGHGSGNPLTFAERELYELAVVFMLAWPYGYPQIMSSYAFSGPNVGPPSDADGKTRSALTPTGECAAGWICEHRWPAVASMGQFRNTTSTAFVTTNFWTDGDRQIAFGRGGRGFVVINASGTAIARRLQTSLPEGDYCDVIARAPLVRGCAGGPLHVDRDGRVDVRVAPMRALALQIDRRGA